jgi:hypothetical protein
MIQIQYAFKDGIRYDINDPLVETGQRYLLIDGAIEYKVYPAKGKKNKHHFRSMPGELIEVDRIFHLNCQYYIQDNKTVEIDNLKIICHKVLLEAEAARYIKAKIPDYSMRPDCLFLDSDGKIMCIVEVNVTHAKSDEDIEKIEQYKIPTIELTYGKRKDNYKQPIRTEWLYFREEESYEIEIRNRIGAGHISIQQAYAKYKETDKHIRAFNTRVRPSRIIEHLIEQIDYTKAFKEFNEHPVQKPKKI